MTRHPRGAVPALVAVTAIWGSTFVVVKDAIDRMPVLDFLAWRFGLATLALVVVRPRALGGLDPTTRRRGALLGVALGAGYLFQTYGLRTADAAVSGFVTSMFVVFTPLCAALLLRRRVPASAWFAVLLATVGLALLSLRGFAVESGELLTLACAVAFALHIVGLGEWSPRVEPYGLAVAQLATVTVLCLVPAAADGLVAPPDRTVWWALAVTALAATALAFVVQTWAQAHLAPTRAAIVMTMEPVFAGLFAVALADETFGPARLAGGALILVAMLAAELGPRQGADAEVPRLEA